MFREIMVYYQITFGFSAFQEKRLSCEVIKHFSWVTWVHTIKDKSNHNSHDNVRNAILFILIINPYF